MATTIELRASDGHELSAYLAPPPGPPRGALIVVQESFGVNSHIRSVVDGYATEGCLAIAPALFDRVERGSFDAACAATARARTLAFVREHVGS